MSRNIYFIHGGGFGTDAGGWYIGPDGKLHKVPGWNPEAMLDLSHSLQVLGAAGRIREKGLTDSIIKSVMPSVQRQLEANVKDGGILVIS
jgi:hypothetical protein